MKKLLPVFLATAISSYGVSYTWDADDTIDELNTEFGTTATSISDFYLGEIVSLSSSYDTVTEIFTWDATFGEVRNSVGSTPASEMPDGNRIIDAYTLIVNSGWGVPTGTTHDVVAQINVEFVDVMNPTVTVYSYQPGGSAFDGTLLSAVNDPNINILASSIGSNQTRVELTIDASAINNANLGPYWRGIEFDDEIGMWFHMYTGTEVTYDADGALTHFSNGTGLVDATWLDMDHLDTETIPEPSAAILSFLGIFGLVARRRRS